MDDQAFREFVKRSVSGRRMPEEVRRRVLARLRVPSRRWAPVAAAAAVLVAGMALLFLPSTPPASLQKFVGLHAHTLGVDWTAPSLTTDEIRAGITSIGGDSFAVPDLRDAGFVALSAHVCTDGAAHIVFVNRIALVSCFVLRNKLPEKEYDFGSLDVYTCGNTVWVGDLPASKLAILSHEREDRARALAEAVLMFENPEVGPALRILEAVLAQVPGVDGVVLDRERLEVRVRYDSRITSGEELAGELAIWGFDAVPLAHSH